MFTKKVAFSVSAALLLTACASPMTMKERNQVQIQSIKQVQIVYPAQDNFYVLYEAPKSSVGGLGGLLGPVGALIGAAVEIGSASGMAKQNNSRSIEFMDKALQENPSPAYMNELVVNKLKTQLEKQNYKVITTRVPMEQKQDVSQLLKLAEKIEGYSTLALRVSSGYYAKGVTKPYNPQVVVRYVLSGGEKSLLDGRKEVTNDKISYSKHEQIMSDFTQALNNVKTELEPMGDVVYKEIFDFSEVKGK